MRRPSCHIFAKGSRQGVAYPHLAVVASHLGYWLPGEYDDAVAVPMTNRETGEVVVFGTLRLLLVELDRLNRDWGMTRDWADLGSVERICDDDDPHNRAKVGWARLRGLCRRAQEMYLPMMLSG